MHQSPFRFVCALLLTMSALLVVAGCASAERRDAAHTSAEGALLVAGGSGRAGVYVLRELRAQGKTFRATTRNAAEARARLGAEAEGVTWVEADLRDPAAATRALQGVDRVICVIGSREFSGANSAEFVDYGAVKNLIDAAMQAKVQHVVLLSAIGASDPESLPNKLFKGALEWRYKGEQHLRASGLAYTIVRPAGLTNEPAGKKGVGLYQGDEWQRHVRKTISREDLAQVLIESLRNPGARNATFEIANEPDEPPGTWLAQLAALKAD